MIIGSSPGILLQPCIVSCLQSEAPSTLLQSLILHRALASLPLKLIGCLIHHARDYLYGPHPAETSMKRSARQEMIGSVQSCSGPFDQQFQLLTPLQVKKLWQLMPVDCRKIVFRVEHGRLRLCHGSLLTCKLCC